MPPLLSMPLLLPQLLLPPPSTWVRSHHHVVDGYTERLQRDTVYSPKWPDIESHDPDVFTRQKPHRVAWGAAPSNPMYFFPDEHIGKPPNWYPLPIRALYRDFL